MAITAEMLIAQKKELLEEIERIQKELKLIDNMILVRKGQPTKPALLPQRIAGTSHSVRGRVIDAAIELIHTLGKQVENKEILEDLNKRGISLGDTKNKQAMLAAILSQEIRKKSARLKKVARGVYDIK
jgi:hypothetical protein